MVGRKSEFSHVNVKELYFFAYLCSAFGDSLPFGKLSKRESGAVRRLPNYSGAVPAAVNSTSSPALLS